MIDKKTVQIKKLIEKWKYFKKKFIQDSKAREFSLAFMLPQTR